MITQKPTETLVINPYNDGDSTMNDEARTRLDALSIIVDDAKGVIDGMTALFDDVLLRDMEMDRRKICVIAFSLQSLSYSLERGLEEADPNVRSQL